MKLIFANTSKEVKIGDIVSDFRGNSCKVVGYEKPHSVNSTGRVHLIRSKGSSPGTYYPSVINALWIQ